jgi:hypothetical protein
MQIQPGSRRQPAGTLSDSFKRKHAIGIYAPDVAASTEATVYRNVLGDAAHRLPWVLPSQERDHIQRIAVATTRRLPALPRRPSHAERWDPEDEVGPSLAEPRMRDATPILKAESAMGHGTVALGLPSPAPATAVVSAKLVELATLFRALSVEEKAALAELMETAD